VGPLPPIGRQRPHGVGGKVARLAERQHGVVSRRQLRRLGISDDTVDGALGASRLLPVFRGVYAVGHTRIGARGRMMAAVLACGRGTVVSHQSAAVLLGLASRAPVTVDVIAPGDGGRKVDGIRVHRVLRPTAEEVGQVDGIPCTSPARTLVDLAGVVRERTLRAGFERAAADRRLNIAAVEAAARRAARPGTPLVLAICAEWRAASALAPDARLRSPFEARLLPLLAATELPAPLVNAAVDTPGGRLEVDLLWPDHSFVVEADSRRHHGADLAFERDRWRDRELMRVGYGTLRPTWRQVEDEPELVLDAIRLELEARSGPSGPGPRPAGAPRSPAR
jgi:very-short-patch-repair endonuclease